MPSQEELVLEVKAVENGDKNFGNFEISDLLIMLPHFGIYTQKAAVEELLGRSDFSVYHLSAIREKIRESVWEEFSHQFLGGGLKSLSSRDLQDIILGSHEEYVQVAALQILGEKGTVEDFLAIIKQSHSIQLQNQATSLFIAHSETTKRHLHSALKRRGGLAHESQRLIVQEILKNEISANEMQNLLQHVDDEPARQMLLREIPVILKQLPFDSIGTFFRETKDERLQEMLVSLISQSNAPVAFYTTLLGFAKTPRVKSILAWEIMKHKQCSQSILRGLLIEGSESFGEAALAIHKAATEKLHNLLAGEPMRYLFSLYGETRSSRNTSVLYIVKAIILERITECSSEQLKNLLKDWLFEGKENICQAIIKREDTTVETLGEVISKMSAYREICLAAARKVIQKLE